MTDRFDMPRGCEDPGNSHHPGVSTSLTSPTSRDWGRRWWHHFVLIATLIAGGIAFPLAGYRYPMDGARYVAAAEFLADSGRLADPAQVPRQPLRTYQAGIVYLVAGLRVVLRGLWPVGYVVVVALLWTVAIGALREFFDVFLAQYYDPPPKYAALASSYLFLLQYQTLRSTTAFFNEAVYLPALLFFLATVSRLLVTTDLRALSRTHPFSLVRPRVAAALVAFLLVGTFFRIQHLVILTAACVVLGTKGWRYIALAISVFAVAVGSFYWYTIEVASPFSDNLLKESWLSGHFLNIASLSRAAGMFGAPFNGSEIARVSAWAGRITAAAAAVLCIVGLANLWRRFSTLAIFCVLIIAGNVLFILALPPWNQPRYYLPAMFCTVVGLVVAPAHLLKPQALLRGLEAAVAVFMVTVLLLSYSYFSGKSAYGVRVQMARRYFAEAWAPHHLIYSVPAGIPYWLEGVPACVVPPAECAQAMGAGSYEVVYLGRRSDFDRALDPAAYRLGEPLFEPELDTSVWITRAAESR